MALRGSSMMVGRQPITVIGKADGAQSAGGVWHVALVYCSCLQLAIRCPSLGPFPSIGGGAHRPLTTRCPSSSSSSYLSISTYLSFPLVGCANGCAKRLCARGGGGPQWRGWGGEKKSPPPSSAGGGGGGLLPQETLDRRVDIKHGPQRPVPTTAHIRSLLPLNHHHHHHPATPSPRLGHQPTPSPGP